MPLIRSVSGLRATQGDDLTPVVVSRYASAFARHQPEGAIAVARDGRPSGVWMERVVAGTLSAHGREVHLLGVAPTPTAQLYAEKTGEVAGAIILTASHNPAEWNGMKFIGADGVFLDGEENLAFWSRLEKPDYLPIISSPTVEKVVLEAVERHIAAVLDVIPADLLRKIRSRSFTVVVDAVNASGSRAIPALLEMLGCTAIPLFCDASGIFPHTPEPLPDNLTVLASAVRRYNADLGIAVDPDADRLVLADETGTVINEELTIALAARAVFACGLSGDYAPVCVVNYSTSRVVDEAVRPFGATVRRAPVGEINVVRAMQRHRAAIGGEGSGGVIVPACHYGRDSLVGTALVLALLAHTGYALHELTAGMPKFSMSKSKFPLSGELEQVFVRLKHEFSGANFVQEDGLYFDFGRQWLHIRASNTEPIVRAIAESDDVSQTGHLLEIVRQSIGGC